MFLYPLYDKTSVYLLCPYCLFLQNLSYDLGDCTRWEYMFPNTDKPLLQIPEAEDDIMDGLDDEDVSIVVLSSVIIFQSLMIFILFFTNILIVSSQI